MGGLIMYQIPEAISSMEESTGRAVQGLAEQGSTQALHDDLGAMPMSAAAEVGRD